MPTSAGHPRRAKNPRARARESNAYVTKQDRIGDAEHGDATLADAFEIARGLLELIWMHVLAAADDEVLGTAGRENLPARDVAEVTGVEPISVKQGPRRFGVAEIARGRRRAAKLDASFPALGQLALGKAILDGELDVQNGEQSTTLATAEFVLMKIEIKQKKRTNHVDIKLRWPRRPLIRVEPYPRRTT